MPARQKYLTKIVTQNGTAFDLISYMDIVSIREEIRRALDVDQRAVFDGLMQDDSSVTLEIDPKVIIAIFHHKYHAPKPQMVQPAIVGPRIM